MVFEGFIDALNKIQYRIIHYPQSKTLDHPNQRSPILSNLIYGWFNKVTFSHFFWKSYFRVCFNVGEKYVSEKVCWWICMIFLCWYYHQHTEKFSLTYFTNIHSYFCIHQHSENISPTYFTNICVGGTNLVPNGPLVKADFRLDS